MQKLQSQVRLDSLPASVIGRRDGDGVQVQRRQIERQAARDERKEFAQKQRQVGRCLTQRGLRHRLDVFGALFFLKKTETSFVLVRLQN